MQLAAEIERGIADGKLDARHRRGVAGADGRAVPGLCGAASRPASNSRRSRKQFVSRDRRHGDGERIVAAADLAVFELGMWQSWTGR